ncbi:TadE family type IV pilus minor pilin [Bifidobacterium aerophilum]|uniref:Pilus assembly protein n=1 Tax=Bifidobacterium aerophilum TaxID=1798155 RepID=A0A6N9Z6F8_9BIFI|nr:TadE family type IV pilus minor pilin [Bifidobacterium aerophilum]NEG90036.1 pilus assembly protein [Bifidobacterium aerophilum]
MARRVAGALSDILRRADRGAATAEFAVVLPAVVAVAALLFGLSRAVIVTMGCQDAAAAVARELIVAGKDGGFDAQATARAVAGDGVAVAVSYGDGGSGGTTVTVVAQCPVVPDPLGVLPTRVTGRATGVMP